jgi:hypothetical protein
MAELENKNPEELMQRLVTAKYIDINYPRKSKFFELTEFNGPMYKVFSEEELIIILDWIESLSNRPIFCVEPIPDTPTTQDWPEMMASLISSVAGRARRAHQDLVLPGPSGDPIPLVDLFDAPKDLMAALIRGGWVVPGLPDSSLFLTRIILSDGPMQGVLDDESVNIIRKWIENGAELESTQNKLRVAIDINPIEIFTSSQLKHALVRPFIGQGAVH